MGAQRICLIATSFYYFPRLTCLHEALLRTTLVFIFTQQQSSCKYLWLKCIHFSLLLHPPPPETEMPFSGNVGVYTRTVYLYRKFPKIQFVVAPLCELG